MSTAGDSPQLTKERTFGEYLGPDAPSMFAVRAGLPCDEVLREASNILESLIALSMRLGSDMDGENNAVAVQLYALERLLTTAKALIDSADK